MSVTQPDRSMLADLLGPAPAMTLDLLPGRLRDGPLRTMLTLGIRAGTLVAVAENDRQRLEKLVELMQLARIAAMQFQHFTIELQDLIDRSTPTERQNPVTR